MIHSYVRSLMVLVAVLLFGNALAEGPVERDLLPPDLTGVIEDIKATHLQDQSTEVVEEFEEFVRTHFERMWNQGIEIDADYMRAQEKWFLESIVSALHTVLSAIRRGDGSLNETWFDVMKRRCDNYERNWKETLSKLSEAKMDREKMEMEAQRLIYHIQRCAMYSLDFIDSRKEFFIPNTDVLEFLDKYKLMRDAMNPADEMDWFMRVGGLDKYGVQAEEHIQFLIIVGEIKVGIMNAAMFTSIMLSRDLNMFTANTVSRLRDSDEASLLYQQYLNSYDQIDVLRIRMPSYYHVFFIAPSIASLRRDVKISPNVVMTERYRSRDPKYGRLIRKLENPFIYLNQEPADP